MIDVRSVCEMQNSEVVCKMWESLNPKSSVSPISDNISSWGSQERV